MSENYTTIIIIGIGIVFIWILGKSFLGMAKGDGKKLSKKEMLQKKVDNIARESDEERWHAVGKSARGAAKHGGLLGRLILLGIFIIGMLALFDTFGIAGLLF